MDSDDIGVGRSIGESDGRLCIGKDKGRVWKTMERIMIEEND